MNVRLGLAAALILCLLVQGYALIEALRFDPLQESAPMADKERAGKRVVPRSAGVSFYAKPPAQLPDLNTGYIFNEQRNLAGAAGSVVPGRKVEDVSMENVEYSGSVITQASTRALLTYTITGPATRRRVAAGGREGHLTVEVGDTVDGYKVSEILPEKIIFTKGGEKIEKILRDRAKAREQAVPQTLRRVPTPTSPQSAARVQPAPVPPQPAPVPIQPEREEARPPVPGVPVPD